MNGGSDGINKLLAVAFYIKGEVQLSYSSLLGITWFSQVHLWLYFTFYLWCRIGWFIYFKFRSKNWRWLVKIKTKRSVLWEKRSIDWWEYPCSFEYPFQTQNYFLGPGENRCLIYLYFQGNSANIYSINVVKKLWNILWNIFRNFF